MRRILIVLAVGALTAMAPLAAMAGNQEIANAIAGNLRDSGRLSDYHIAVKVQEGTATLKGNVTSREQLNAAMRIAFQTPGVSRVVNELAVGEETAMSMPASAMQADQTPATFESAPVQQTSALELLPRRRAAAQAQQIQAQPVAMQQPMTAMPGYTNQGPRPMGGTAAPAGNVAAVRYDQPCMPNYAWPSYASSPNYAAVTYPKQYSAASWPFIGPFYPYPQVPLGWRKVTMEWDDGWWYLNFSDKPCRP